jgi:hypothetical protein
VVDKTVGKSKATDEVEKGNVVPVETRDIFKFPFSTSYVTLHNATQTNRELAKSVSAKA